MVHEEKQDQCVSKREQMPEARKSLNGVILVKCL